MPWLELTIQTREACAEKISHFLEESDAVSITWQAAATETLLEPDIDSMPLWQHVNISALFNETVVISDVIETLCYRFPSEDILRCNVKSIADKAWERVWLDDFHPMCFGKRLWIYPSVLEPSDSTAFTVRLDPGLAFGTGTHPSTALCLEWIDASIQGGETMLDYGCGSGILAIAALKCGAQRVFAVDHDPQALEATKMNAERNAITCGNISCLFPHQLQPTIKMDVIIANILAKPLIDLAKRFKHVIKIGGKCVLSGILAEQVESIQKNYSDNGFTPIGIHYKQNWACIVARRDH